MRFLSILALGVCFAGCGGGSYGFTREYVTLSDEDDYAEQATEVSYEEVKRDPASFRSQTIGWFGVVTAVELDAATGQARVAMSQRIHQDRHLCADERESSCRVTVSERANGPFTAVVTLRPEDRDGEGHVWLGSLLKVYGSPNGEFDAEGGPVITTRYYRHWPRGTYVTTGDRNRMRR